MAQAERAIRESWRTRLLDAWPLTFPRVNTTKLVNAVPAGELEQWKAQVARQQVGPLGVPYTEQRLRFVVLRWHATIGQIDPAFMRRLPNVDLEYLAGSTEPLGHDGSVAQRGSIEATRRIQDLKVAENAIRASRELARRAQIRSTTVAAVVGAAAALIVANFPNLVDWLRQLL